MIISFVGNFSVPYSSESHHKKTLESMGHEVIALQEGVVNTMEIYNKAITSKLLIWVHTHNVVTPERRITVPNMFERLHSGGIKTATYHLDLWLGIDRQKDLDRDPFYKTIGNFFTVDKLMADWFNDYTQVRGHYLQAGVLESECYIASKSENIKDVIFVGSRNYHPEWQYRPELIDWLSETYRDNFTRYAGDTPMGTTRGEALNQAYSDSKIAIGDSLCIGFKYPYYWSDRVYETLGRGGFMIHPYIKGMDAHFEDNEHLVYYEFGNLSDLKAKIDYYLNNDDKREKIRLAGHEHVKKNHTYRNRWESILKTLELA